jgi:purine nucleosidase
VILDCDPGTDDAVAIMLALASPEIDVRAITVTGGNVGLAATLANALALVELIGAVVPVHAGADRSLLQAFAAAPQVHGEDGLGGVFLPGTRRAEAELAADCIRRILRHSAVPVTLVGIGPATNFALALASEPAVAENIAEIVLMSGAWGEGNITPAAEFNAFNDPEALAILASSGRKLTLVTLDLTAQALVTPARLGALRGAGDGRCLSVICDILATVPPSAQSGGSGAPLHDPCAIAWLVRPDLFTTRDCGLTVDLGPGPSRGRTVIDRWHSTRGVGRATVPETIDSDGFFSLLAERLARLP